jgi:hypothetical protein
VRGPLPVGLEGSGARVEKPELGRVRRLHGIAELIEVERSSPRVRVEDVQAAVADERGHSRHGVDDSLDAEPDPLRRCGPALRPIRIRRAYRGQQIRAYGLVEPEGAADRIEHVVRHSVGLPVFQPRVVLRADARQERHLLAPQACDPAPAVCRQAGLLRRNVGPSSSEEFANLICIGHVKAKVRTDDETLRRLAQRYADQGWPARVEDGAFTYDFSAPSAGPPPWDLYAVTPTTVFGVLTTEPGGATRWRFDP